MQEDIRDAMKTPDMESTTLITPITHERMADILGLPDEKAEPIFFSRLQQIAATWELGYAEVGLICRQVDAYLLWEKRIDPETGEPCASFSRWVHVCCPRSFATVYAAMRDVEELKDVPAEHVAKIPASNFPVMKQLSSAVRNDPQVLEAAKSQNAEQFVETIRRDHPNQHIEHRQLLRFRPVESAAAKIKEALNRAEQMGAHNWDEALEWLAQWAMDWLEFKSEEMKIDAAMKDLPTDQIQ